MKITIDRYNLIRNKLEEIITINGIEWKDIVSEIEKITKVKNWLIVRGIIQDLKDENIIVRDDNIMKEIYIMN